MRYARAVAMTAILGSLGLGLVSVAPAQAGTTPACRNVDLKASFVRKDAGAGHVYGKLRLRNVSGHACTTGGFGGLSYVGHGNGTQIGSAADRDHTIAAKTIKLDPGQRVISWVDMVSAAPFPKKKCKPTAADGFRVYVPNATKSQFVPYETTGCANPAIHLLSHRAYRRP